MDGMCSTAGGTEKNVQHFGRNYVQKRAFFVTNITSGDNTKTDFEKKHFSM
jgi:hypothetical protein